MRILFIVDIDFNNKTGLFLATHERIKQYALNGNSIYVLNVYERDSKPLRLLKKLTFKKVLAKKKKFQYEGIEYNELTIRQSILRIIYKRIFINKDINVRDLNDARKLLHNYDMIQAHWGILPGSVARNLKRKEQICYTLTLHGSDIHTVPYANNRLRTIVGMNLENANICFFVSESLRTSALSYFPMISKEKCFISYNGIDFNIFYQKRKDVRLQIKNNLKLKSKVVTFVGNLVTTKNAEMLPDIFQKISERFNSISFIIIGSGELQKKIEAKLKQKNLKVIFYGKVDKYEVAEVLNVSDLLVLPSKNESFGLVILEAISCGCKVIGSNAGGIYELLGSRYTVDRNDERFLEQFTEKALEILFSKGQEYNFNYLDFSWTNCYTNEIRIVNKYLIQESEAQYDKYIKESKT